MQFAQQIREVQHEISQLERGRVDRARRFGESVPDILLQIEEAHKRGKFVKKPRGPLGIVTLSYQVGVAIWHIILTFIRFLGLNITVKDEKWAPVIEKSIGSLCKSFVCDNWQDSKELEKILTPYFRNSRERRPQIIVSK